MNPTAPISEDSSSARSIREAKDLVVETWIASAVTVLAAILFVLAALHAGPLWRDEVNTINIAQSSSLTEVWNNLSFESFPPLYIFVLRGWGWLGMAASDAGIRMLGVLIGVLYLGFLWVCAKCVGGGPPTISVAMLGGLPSIIFVVTSNRAYGLSLCLLTLSFAAIWRLVESPTRLRFVLAGMACFLFAHCLYYNVVFLSAMLLGGMLVALRRRRWNSLIALAGIGSMSAVSMSIYLSVVRQVATYVFMFQPPHFGLSLIWKRLNEAITYTSGAQPASAMGNEVWVWATLMILAIVTAAWVLYPRPKAQTSASGSFSALQDPIHARVDLVLFSVTAMICGMVGLLGFLLKLRYPTQSWYYVGLFTLCAVSLQAVFGPGCLALRPWRIARIAFPGLMILLGWRGSWEEAHMRRSNVDLIASALEKEAGPADLIVVHSAWEGITFDRYYHGKCDWRTIPPVISHKVHRLDQIQEMLNRSNALDEVLTNINSTLRKGGSVWVVGNLRAVLPGSTILSQSGTPPDRRWLGFYFSDCGARVAAQLNASASRMRALEIPFAEPVNSLENLPVFRYSGAHSGDASK